MIRRCLALLLVLTPLSHAASCGSGAVPFRFEVLPSGTPVLGCGVPQCFGTQSGGRAAPRDAIFNPTSDGEDGFIRDGDLTRSHVRFGDAPSQLADCPASYESSSCENPLTWVGGFQASTGGLLRLQCCHYNGLRFGVEVGKPVVHAGEVYSGGEVLRDGRQTGFDLISNVKKLETSDGSIAYEVTVTRMNCLPDPVEGTNSVAIQTRDISRILDKVGDIQHSPQQQPQLLNSNINNGGFQGELETNSIQQGGPIQSQGGTTYNQGPSDGGQYVQPPQQPVAQDEYVQVGEQVIPVTEAGYYYPVASGVPACFTGDTVVDTPSGPKNMEDLKIGDLVLTMQSSENLFTRVKSFMHRLPDVTASFIKLETEKNVLKLTPQHFIYRTNCNSTTESDMVYAEDIKVGDCLFESALNVEQVLNVVPVKRVSVVLQQGVYAPMTETGDLLVNNIYASCHNVIKSSSLTHTFLDLLFSMQNKMRSLFGGEDDGHLPSTSEFFLNVIDVIIPHKY